MTRICHRQTWHAYVTDRQTWHAYVTYRHARIYHRQTCMHAHQIWHNILHADDASFLILYILILYADNAAFLMKLKLQYIYVTHRHVYMHIHVTHRHVYMHIHVTHRHVYMHIHVTNKHVYMHIHVTHKHVYMHQKQNTLTMLVFCKNQKINSGGNNRQTAENSRCNKI
jgi:hypothetical protein